MKKVHLTVAISNYDHVHEEIFYRFLKYRKSYFPRPYKVHLSFDPEQ